MMISCWTKCLNKQQDNSGKRVLDNCPVDSFNPYRLIDEAGHTCFKEMKESLYEKLMKDMPTFQRYLSEEDKQKESVHTTKNWAIGVIAVSLWVCGIIQIINWIA